MDELNSYPEGGRKRTVSGRTGTPEVTGLWWVPPTSATYQDLGGMGIVNRQYWEGKKEVTAARDLILM
jgi:hypothetical protein